MIQKTLSTALKTINWIIPQYQVMQQLLTLLAVHREARPALRHCLLPRMQLFAAKHFFVVLT